MTVATPKGQSVEVQYRVMEADLVASHDFEGNINHDYPQQLQPRDRSKQTYRVQVGQIAAAPEGRAWPPARRPTGARRLCVTALSRG